MLWWIVIGLNWRNKSVMQPIFYGRTRHTQRRMCACGGRAHFQFCLACDWIVGIRSFGAIFIAVHVGQECVCASSVDRSLRFASTLIFKWLWFCFESYLFHRWWIHFCRHRSAADPLRVMSLLLLLWWLSWWWWWCPNPHHWLRSVQSVHFRLCSIFSSYPTFVCSILNFPRSSVRQYPIRRSFCSLSLPFPTRRVQFTQVFP